MTGTVNLAQLAPATTMHHVVDPKPLRGTPTAVKTRCGRTGAPGKIETKVDARAVRVKEGVVCVSCIELAGWER